MIMNCCGDISGKVSTGRWYSIEKFFQATDLTPSPPLLVGEEENGFGDNL